MSKATRMARARYPGRRLISHFMQPHYPFLSLPDLSGFTDIVLDQARNPTRRRTLQDKTENIIENIYSTNPQFLRRLGIRRIVDNLPIKVRRPYRVKQVAEEAGIPLLLEAYRDNLRVALGEVAKLTERLPGKMVVTSDHGELLGEGGKYEHASLSNDPILLEVPWLEVESKQDLESNSPRDGR